MGHRAKVLTTLSMPAILLGAWLGSATAGDVLTQHNDNFRSGANIDETILNAKTLRTGAFGKLWTLYADGQIVAQPLYVAKLAIDTAPNPDTPPVRGTFNTVIVATMHNTVYAYDADSQRRGPDGHTVPLWARWLGPPRPSGKDIDMWSTNDPEWGILGTPVVSNDRKSLYVVAWHDDGPQGIRYKLHALDPASGAERKSAVIGVSSVDPSQPCKRQSAFNPCTQKQRSALLLSDGVLYIGLGGDGSRGALFAFDAASLTQKAFWSTTPTGADGGIWQSGQGPAADAEGNVYVMTANGTFDGDTNKKNYGDSFVKLHFEGQNLVGQRLLHPVQSGSSESYRPRPWFLRSCPHSWQPTLDRRWRQGRHIVCSVANQHGTIFAQPEGTGLPEHQCAAAADGVPAGDTRRADALWQHPWFAGLLEGAGR